LSASSASAPLNAGQWPTEAEPEREGWEWDEAVADLLVPAPQVTVAAAAVASAAAAFAQPGEAAGRRDGRGAVARRQTAVQA